jgi:hypothetical protein
MTWVTVMEYCVTNDHGYIPLVVNSSRSFTHSWLITEFVTRLTRRVSPVEQELHTLPEHMSSPPIFSGVRVTKSLVLYVCFLDRICPFVLFLLANVLSVLLWYTDSDYRFKFGIFKLYLLWFKFLFISEWLFCLPLKLYWCYRKPNCITNLCQINFTRDQIYGHCIDCQPVYGFWWLLWIQR